MRMMWSFCWENLSLCRRNCSSFASKELFFLKEYKRERAGGRICARVFGCEGARVCERKCARARVREKVRGRESVCARGRGVSASDYVRLWTWVSASLGSREVSVCKRAWAHYVSEDAFYLRESEDVREKELCSRERVVCRWVDVLNWLYCSIYNANINVSMKN